MNGQLPAGGGGMMGTPPGQLPLLPPPPPYQQQMLQQQGWFVGAPLAKWCAMATTAIYVSAHVRHAVHKLAWDADKILYSGEYYRYLSSKLSFCSSGGAFFMGTAFLVFLMRKMERELGTRRFCLFVLFCNTVAICMEHLFLLNVSYTAMSHYNGPFATVGALFYLFHTYQPRLYPRFFGILGFWFSEKSFYYLWFLQVAFLSGSGSSNQYWRTALPTLFGFLSALLWKASGAAKHLDVPDAVVHVVAPFWERIAEPPPRILVPGRHGGLAPAAVLLHPANNNNNNRARMPGAAGGDGRGATAGAVRPIHPIFGQGAAAAENTVRQQQQQRTNPPPEPDPAALEQLQMMGFDRQRVIAALLVTNNDVQRAADRLLTQQGIM